MDAILLPAPMIGNPLKVKDFVSEQSRGEIQIPEIQRAYVWKRSQIAKLLDSLYRGFPTGSILLWDTKLEIQIREMSANLGRGIRPDFVPKIVLDGQQRLTSLARVFDRSTPRDERVLFNVVEEKFEPYSHRSAADPRWIDVTQLLTEEASVLDIIDRLQQAEVVGKTREDRDQVFARLNRLSQIKDYQFPVEIVRDDDLETVTEVFIRVNSGGTRLRDAELALARLAWKLPGSIIGPFQKMEDDCQERGFNLDSRFLMRALVSVATRQSRFKDLKAFWSRPAEELQKAWNKTEKGIRLALDFVEGNVGIPGSELLPSDATLIAPILIFSERQTLRGDEERILRRWFLLANTFSRYTGSPETTLNQDLATLGEGAENVAGLHEQLIKDLRTEPKIVPGDLERAGSSSPFFPLAYLAVVNRDANDWFRGIRIRRESFSDDQQVEYHHIFPKKHLDAMGVDRYIRDEMANLAFLSQKANRRILARKPDDYLEEIARQDGGRLEAQFVPMDRSLWQLDRYPEFLSARRALLSQAMSEVIGS